MASGVELLIPSVRETFSCDGMDYGYYADVGNNCQIFHICVPPIQHYTFFCGNGTIFDQRTLVCTREEEATPCQEAERYYIINSNFGKTDPAQYVQVK